jgi:hypothetical protein
MRRRAVLCTLGGTGSLALAGCLDLDLGSDDDTDDDTGGGTGGDSGGNDDGDGRTDDGDSGTDDGEETGNGDPGGSDGGGGDGDGDGDGGTNSGDGGGGDGSGADGDSDTGAGEPSLSVSVDPGQTGRRNEYTLTVDGVGSLGGATVGEVAIGFDEQGGVERFVLSGVRVEDVEVTAAAVDSVQAGETRQLLITPANPLPLSGIEGAVVVTVERLRAPSPGEFSLTLALRTGDGETVAELDGSYRIDESP